MILAHWIDKKGQRATYYFNNEEQMNNQFQFLANKTGEPIRTEYSIYESTREKFKTYNPEEKKEK